MRRLCRTFALIAAIAAAVQCAGTVAHAQTPIIPFGIEGGTGPWDYLHPYVGNLAVNPDSDPDFLVEGIALWALPSYSLGSVQGVYQTGGGAETVTWQQGNAPFDYGTVDGIRTYINANAGSGTILPTPNSGERFTTYLRKSFTLAESLDNLSINGIIDDGAVVYIDGFEVGRMGFAVDGGAVGTIPAFNSQVAGANSETTASTVVLDLSVFGGSLDAGTHVVGIQLMNDQPGSTDLGAHVRLLAQIGVNELLTGAAGSLGDVNNWSFGDSPDGVDGLLRMNNDAGTLYFNGNYVVGDINMNNANGYTIAGLGQLVFESADGASTWNVQQGVNDIQIQTALRAGATEPPTTATNLVLNVSTGASIAFNNDVILNGNTFTVSGGGTAAFNNYVQGSISAAAASIVGNATVGGNLNNNANVSPGDGIGTMTVEGNYNQGADGELSIQIGGNGQFDVMRVLGIMDVDGTLNVSLLGGYDPAVGESFQVFNFGSLTGQFDTVNLPELSGGKNWDMSNLYAAGSLSVVPEPGAFLLGGFGMLLLGFARRTR